MTSNLILFSTEVIWSSTFGFLHSTFSSTMQAIMENTEQNQARNWFLLSSTCLISLVWQVSLPFERSLSSLTVSTPRANVFACSWDSLGSAQRQGMSHLLLHPPPDHLSPSQEVDLTWPILNKVIPTFNYLIFQLPAKWPEVHWLCYQLKVLPSSTPWKEILFSLCFLGYPLSLTRS